MDHRAPKEVPQGSRATGPRWRGACAAGNRALGNPGAGVNGRKLPVKLLHPVGQEVEKDIHLFIVIHITGNKGDVLISICKKLLAIFELSHSNL